MTEVTEPPPEATATPTLVNPPDEISRYLDEIEDADLIKLVEDLTTEVRHLDVENQVFEHFLQKNEPSLLTGMVQILELAAKVQVHTQSHSTLMLSATDRRDTTDSLRATSSRRTDSVVKFTTTTASTSDRGQRINLSQKMDLSMREIEEMQIALDDFIKKSHRIHCDLKAKLEELVVRESEVQDARTIFEQAVVTEGVDSLTGKIPAEKFLRYMDEWLRSAETSIGKVRLRTSTSKALFLKLCSRLVQKEELGESIDAADFDQLRIENKHLGEKIEEKTNHLLELKRMNGAANLVLTTNRKYLQKQVHAIKKMKNLIKFKEQKIIELDKECENVAKQVQKEKEKCDKTFNLTLNYTVPETLDYIKTEAKLTDLKKQMKILERKNKVQQFELKTCIREMKNLTGVHFTQASWFQVMEKNSFDSMSTCDDLLKVGNSDEDL